MNFLPSKGGPSVLCSACWGDMEGEEAGPRAGLSSRTGQSEEGPHWCSWRPSESSHVSPLGRELAEKPRAGSSFLGYKTRKTHKETRMSGREAGSPRGACADAQRVSAGGQGQAGHRWPRLALWSKKPPSVSCFHTTLSPHSCYPRQRCHNPPPPRC